MQNEISVYWLLLLQLALILVNAVFACAEIAVISINGAKLKNMAQNGDRRAVRLMQLTAQPARFLATIQVGITLAGFLASAFAADNFAGYITAWLQSLGLKLPAGTLNTISLVVITLVLSYFTLVLGELVPKRLAMQKAERLGLAMSGLIYRVAQVFKPLVWLLTVSTNALLRLLRVNPNAAGQAVTEEEIRLMVAAGAEKGTIDADEKQIIDNVFKLDVKTAKDVMTHRRDVVFLYLNETGAEWEAKIYRNSFSVYPVYDAAADVVTGILRVKDYFRSNPRDRQSLLAGAVKTPYFVSGSLRADILMQEMQQNRRHFAVVLDEFGGMGGIITITDLLEILVGSLKDEGDAENDAPEIAPMGANTWRIKGLAPLSEVAEQLDVKLPVDKYESFGGYVFGELGEAPPDGATPELLADGLRITVEKVKNHRLIRAKVTKQN